jgi:ribonuclease III
MKIDLTKLEKKINLRFKNKDLLKKCLTHKSYNSIDNYEKLEFLGDRVLGLVISEKLLEIFPNEKEGTLDKKFASLVNKNKCFQIAKVINLENFILTSNNNKKNIKIADKIISDSLEALIGALFIDQGLNVVKKFILNLWKDHIDSSSFTFVDAKTQLQEYSLKKYKKLPLYKLLENSGPRHKPIIKVSVKLETTKFIEAKGFSKKDAEQKAAKLLLKSINK